MPLHDVRLTVPMLRSSPWSRIALTIAVLFWLLLLSGCSQVWTDRASLEYRADPIVAVPPEAWAGVIAEPATAIVSTEVPLDDR